MRVLALLALAGCYDAHPVRGVPCGIDTGLCPSGQTCIAGFCDGRSMTDVDAPISIDVAAADDPDHDGIASMHDNCPMLANADQANEDGDKFGDACDPCPIEANDTPSDPDNDGVADGCDPHPNTAGDSLVMFTGFHDGLPTTWQVVGTATAASDEATLTTVGGNHTSLVAPTAALANATVTASIIVDMQVGTFDSATTLSLPYDPPSDEGIFCELYAPNAQSTNGRYVSVWDAPAQLERSSTNFQWTTAVAYRVSLNRQGTKYTCSVTPPAGSAHTTQGNTNSTATASLAAVAVYGANARAQWVMVVTSP